MEKSFRVLITEQCNASCPGCFNADYRSENNMALADFIQLCDYLSSNGVEKLKIMGGEPTVHPEFEQAFRYAQERFPEVDLFTNGLNEQINKIELRENDLIIVNFTFVRYGWDLAKLRLDQPGVRLLEVKVGSGSDMDDIVERLRWIYCFGFGERVGINLTLDCMENIFREKKQIIENWNKLDKFIRQELGISYNIDHNIPFCLFVNSSMQIRPGYKLCNIECSGLIDASLTLRYCNQFSGELVKICQNGVFVPFKIVKNYLQKAYMEKIGINLEKLCADCIFFGEQCNGGCFLHKEFISTEDIIGVTDLEVK